MCTFGELTPIKSWTNSESCPALFSSTLAVICNSIKSQSDTFHFLLILGQNNIKIMFVSCSDRCWRCSKRMCLCVHGSRSFKEEWQKRSWQLLCSFVYICFVSFWILKLGYVPVWYLQMNDITALVMDSKRIFLLYIMNLSLFFIYSRLKYASIFVCFSGTNEHAYLLGIYMKYSFL